jgi:hypothetical protein
MIKINVLSAEQQKLNAAIADFNDAQYQKSFSERHPELGKMIKCAICLSRHRANERGCGQVFTFRVGDYEIFREDEKGDLVPAYRTCVQPDSKPTMKQIVGAAQFKKKRLKQHPNKGKLQFIERVRIVFEGLTNFELGTEAQFDARLKRARVVAARQLRAERELSAREVRRRQDQSRRINRGLLAH